MSHSPLLNPLESLSWTSCLAGSVGWKLGERDLRFFKFRTSYIAEYWLLLYITHLYVALYIYVPIKIDPFMDDTYVISNEIIHLHLHLADIFAVSVIPGRQVALYKERFHPEQSLVIWISSQCNISSLRCICSVDGESVLPGHSRPH